MVNFTLALFFERILFPIFGSYRAQTYQGIVLYVFLAVALCGLLAGIAYLFSLSSVQDSEKRSEYECGFEPFDSATRLPFDVHFYLVGILFLIFDVEIALLFPWVLGLRTVSWFGFYIMLWFIIILAVGFLYEWKRGALIWPAKQQELTYSALPVGKLSYINPYEMLGYALLGATTVLTKLLYSWFWAKNPYDEPHPILYAFTNIIVLLWYIVMLKLWQVLEDRKIDRMPEEGLLTEATCEIRGSRKTKLQKAISRHGWAIPSKSSSSKSKNRKGVKKQKRPYSAMPVKRQGPPPDIMHELILVAGGLACWAVMGYTVYKCYRGAKWCYNWATSAPSETPAVAATAKVTEAPAVPTSVEESFMLTYRPGCKPRLDALLNNQSIKTELAILKRARVIPLFNLKLKLQETLSTLSSWRAGRISNFVKLISTVEKSLQKSKAGIKAFIIKTDAIASSARNKNPNLASKIDGEERVIYDKITKSGLPKLFRELSTQYKGMYKRFVEQKKQFVVDAHRADMRKAEKALIAATEKYLSFQERNAHILKKGVIEKRKKLQKRIKTLYHSLHFRTRRTPLAKRKSKAKPSVRTVRSGLPLIFVTPTYTFFQQLAWEFLPELFLSTAVIIILSVLAMGLGRGFLKKVLSLNSLSAFGRAMIFIAIMYIGQAFIGSTFTLFNGYLITSSYVAGFKLLTLFAGGFILYSSKKYIVRHGRHLLEYPLTMATALLFMLLLVSGGHTIVAFLAVVGFSLNLYVLVLDASYHGVREAGIKYFYLSTLSSGLMLYGIFLVFITLGTGHLLELGQTLATQTETVSNGVNLLELGVTLLFVGLFFKLSAFPGHLWAAEVYEGSPDPVTAFFMLPVKIAVLAFLTQLIVTAFETALPIWQPLIAISAITSLAWGCLAALAETKTKRFLAYASINQIGFLLVGLATGSLEGYRTTLFYLLLYAIMNVGFLIIFLQAQRVDGKGLLYLSDFRNFGQQYSAYSWSLAVVLFSMAGIPPLAGFFGKYYLLLHAQVAGLYIIVAAGLLTSLVSTYYYLRIIKTMWFEEVKETEESKKINAISCSLSWQQQLLLKSAEWSLWIFIVHSGSATTVLNSVIENLFVLNNFIG